MMKYKNKPRQSIDDDVQETMIEALTVQASSFSLPPSTWLSHETIKGQLAYRKDMQQLAQRWAADGVGLGQILKAPLEKIPAMRQSCAEAYYASPSYHRLVERYGVTLQTEMIGDVCCEVFTPTDGVDPANQERVLISLHGGGFIHGARFNSHSESIPIAGLGKIKVISVDYRMAPEHRYPAATDDVMAVYQALLQQYSPDAIGIYGCSAGALISAQHIARLLQEELPLPGAMAMTCSSAHGSHGGDSSCISAGIMPSYPVAGVHSNNIYLDGTDDSDPLVFPGKDLELLAQFPPSLLMTATRDYALSAVVKTHSELVKIGVSSDLHVWEGMEHAFINNTELPESQDAFDVMVSFFSKHLKG